MAYQALSPRLVRGSSFCVGAAVFLVELKNIILTVNYYLNTWKFKIYITIRNF